MINKLINSFGYALQGIVVAFKTQQNFKIETAAAIAVIIAGFTFKISSAEWMSIVLCIGFVLSLELVNTAIENMCNAYTTTINPIIKIVKDTAAGAVLVASIVSFVIALIIFLPKI
jgi:diacylglycerol kinase